MYYVDDDFSQGLILPPLVVQLKKILDQYSDDTQILKVRLFRLTCIFILLRLLSLFVAVKQMVVTALFYLKNRLVELKKRQI